MVETIDEVDNNDEGIVMGVVANVIVSGLRTVVLNVRGSVVVIAALLAISLLVDIGGVIVVKTSPVPKLMMLAESWQQPGLSNP